MEQEEYIEILLNGGIGVYPTDTLYGLVGSALSVDAVERIYAIKQREYHKPLIVLIHNISMLETFGVEVSEALLLRLESYWPGPNTIVLPVIDDQFEYLSRGTDTIAFRLPEKESLSEFLSYTGPLVAPSANVEGHPHSKTIKEAQRFFGTDVDFYADEGELDEKPSTIIAFDNGRDLVIRE